MLKRFIGTFDIHVGWERAYVKGQCIERRVDNTAAINAMLNFASDFKPDIWVLGGDQLNCGPVSHWNKKKPKLSEGFRLADELDLFRSTILKPIHDILPKRRARKIWLTGNHEVWFEQLIEENPGLAGMTSIEKYLDLEARNWEIYSQGEAAQVGKCYYIHGDNLGGGGKYFARRAVEYYRRNVRFGHYHTYEAATLVNPLDASDVHTGIACPCLCSRAPSYGKNAPNRWVNGFQYGYLKPDGTFYDTIVIMTDNEFAAESRMYNDDKKVELLKVA